jgi:hypothetical protein
VFLLGRRLWSGSYDLLENLGEFCEHGIVGVAVSRLGCDTHEYSFD